MRRARRWLTNRARALRANDTSAEAKLWSRLRNRNLAGHKFVRQFPIGSYFADFACRELKIVVEIDGSTHGTDAEVVHDMARTTELTRQGFRVFRAHNRDVYDNIDGVLDALLAFIDDRIE